jgi:two-component system, chemotaxis family, protein-glutamate methylesterase/glutaminase
MPERPIRVLVADDSVTARNLLTQLIEATPGLQVIAEATDGAEAVRLAEILKPDVISMDIRMPGIDGLEATRQIMNRCPTPTVVVSGLIADDIDLSIRALDAGALAVLPKPPARQDTQFAEHHRQYVNTLSAMAKVKVVRRWHEQSAANAASALPKTDPLHPRALPEVIAIGASAGGPSALAELVHALPPLFPLPLLIVQHMPDEFVPGLVRWLEQNTSLRIQIAQDGDMLRGETIYVAPGGVHLTVQRLENHLYIRLKKDAQGARYCPSIDMLLESVAAVCGAQGIGVLLTGMGDDGAEGLLKLRQAGGRTFAQDEESCIVFGIPGAALERGAVERLLPPRKLGELLPQLVKNV